MTKECIKIGIAGQKGQTANYERACTELGLCPLTSLSLSTLSTCDALILPGGSDITPGFYGQENHGSRGINTELDLLQIQALEYFIRAKKPVLGICKGMQLINVYFGGTLIQDLPDDSHHQREDKVDRVHPVNVVHPFLHALYGDRFISNSAHHQAVDRLADGLQLTCVGEDGVVEGFIHENGRIIGMQFHPERMSFGNLRPDADDGAAIFRAFVAML